MAFLRNLRKSGPSHRRLAVFTGRATMRPRQCSAVAQFLNAPLGLARSLWCFIFGRYSLQLGERLASVFDAWCYCHHWCLLQHFVLSGLLR
jgi:hypothetical protein